LAQGFRPKSSRSQRPPPPRALPRGLSPEMSDEDMAPMGGSDMGEDFDDDDDDNFGADIKELPDGVKKEIVKEAPEDNFRTPKKGDDVTVHYVGTLLSDGSQFDSSRDRSDPFVFTLGKGQVIKGWDVGVASMKKGEIAKFTLAPDFAYGESGSPPTIPANATLVFEVELISWMSKDDLFGDEGAIKHQLKEGAGWKTPADGDEVKCSIKATAADGKVVFEKGEVEYTLGSGAFGALAKVADRALRGMKKQEEIMIKVTKDYLLGDETPDGGKVELTLHGLFETKDVSFLKDKSVMKKQIVEGDGWDTPKDASKVTLKVLSATDGEKPLPGFAPATLEFAAGGGEVCDCIEFAVVEMKKGEVAHVTCTRPALCAEAKVGLKEAPKCSTVVLALELEDFEKAKDTWSLSEEEKVEYALSRKEVGGNLFKQGRIEMALERYKKVIDLFSYVDNFKDETKEKATDLKKVCQLNKAACHLKLKQNQDAKKACEEVLKVDTSNVKALYRRAQAQLGLNEFSDCMSDIKRILEIDPQNKEARVLAKDAKAGQKKEDESAKGLFQKMCKGIAVPKKSGGYPA